VPGTKCTSANPVFLDKDTLKRRGIRPVSFSAVRDPNPRQSNVHNVQTFTAGAALTLLPLVSTAGTHHFFTQNAILRCVPDPSASGW